MNRVIIAGSRGITDEALIRAEMNRLWMQIGPYTVISGAARGPDTISAEIAKRAGVFVEYLPADWEKYGKSAGYRRNKEMTKKATHLLAFWDGLSRGTKHMIDIAKQVRLHVTVIHANKERR